MLDPKILRKDTAKVIQNLKRRGYVFDESLWNELEEKRKKLQGFTEEQQSELNDLSKAIGIGKKNSEDTSLIQNQATKLTAQIKELSAELESLLEEIDNFVLSIPNLIDEDVPDGADETENIEIRKEGKPRTFAFTVKDHLEIGRNYEIDMEAGVRITGSRFKVLRNDIAHLQSCLLYTSPSPRDQRGSRMPSSA